MIRDYKAERIEARANAARAAAEAEAIRVQAELARQAGRADLDRQREAERRKVAAERRKAFAGAVRANGHQVLPALAIGSPALIAWRGQLEFARHTMQLGLMSPLLPIALEGGVLYSAYLAHQAVADGAPAGRYRALTWTLAAVAAGMNFWHGSTPEIGVALGLTSLLSIVLLEMTIALRKARETKRSTGRTVADIRRSLIRRVRYPRLSLAAAAVAAARGIDGEAAWRAAWIDRFGIGPDSTRRERQVARAVLRRQRKAARRAAKNGELVIADGALARVAPAPEARDDARVGAVLEGERLDPAVMDTVIDTVVAIELGDGLDDLERFLAAQSRMSGGLLELPSAGDERPDERREERRDERSEDQREERRDERRDERSEDQREERRDERRDERGEERRDERSSGARKRRSVKRSSRSRSARSSRAPQSEHEERVAKARRVLADRPDITGPQLAAELGVAESTARKIRQQAQQQVRDERSERGGEQR